MVRVLIMAGGTGGHVFPALAVASALQQENALIEWMGTQRGIEAKLVAEAAYPLHFIQVQGLRGNGLLAWLVAPVKLIKALLEAMQIIKRVRPNVVLGFGGFASGPGGMAAWLMRKPLLIHEQNALPGLTNRLLAKLAKQVLAGFANSFADLGKVQWVGNPVRASIEELSPPTIRFNGRSEPTRLLVLGGSLGARALNQLLPEAIALLTEQQIVIKHQCGQNHIVACQQHYQQAGVNAEIIAFVEDMAAVYQWADLVICRAGALTIAELAAAGVGSILIPYPYAVDDHQTHNGAALVAAGAAYLLAEDNLTPALLANKINDCISEPGQLAKMAVAARSQAKLGTAAKIASLCLAVAEEAADG